MANSALSNILAGAKYPLSQSDEDQVNTGNAMPLGDGGPISPIQRIATLPVKPAPKLVQTPAPKPAPVQKADDTDKIGVQMPSGHVLSMPKDWPSDLINQIASTFHRVQQQTGDAIGAFTESFGLPGSAAEVDAANKMLPEQLAHPLDTAKGIAKSTAELPGQMLKGQGALLKKAQDAWKSGALSSAASHFINYLVPLIGQASDQAGDEVKSGEYGKAVGHTAGVILPMLFGKPGAGTSSAAAESAEEAATAKPSTKVTPTANVKAVAPMTEAERAAIAYLNKLGNPEVEVEEATSPVSADTESDLPRTKKGPVAKSESVSPDEANKLAEDYISQLEKESPKAKSAAAGSSYKIGSTNDYGKPMPKGLTGSNRIQWLNDNLDPDSKLDSARHELAHYDYAAKAGHPTNDMFFTVGHEEVPGGGFSTGRVGTVNTYWQNLMKNAKTPEARANVSTKYLKQLYAPEIVEEMQGTSPEDIEHVTQNDRATAQKFMENKMGLEPDEAEGVRNQILGQLRKEITPKAMARYTQAAKQLTQHHYGQFTSPWAIDHYLDSGTHAQIADKLAAEDAELNKDYSGPEGSGVDTMLDNMFGRKR